MDDILNVYRLLKTTGTIDASVYAYNNSMCCIDGQSIHMYDISGKMPCGKYRIPSSEAEFIKLIERMDAKIKEVVDNNEFICGKCGGVFDLPEEKTDKNGNLICAKCANGGDFRIDHPKDPAKERKERAEAAEKLPSTTDYLGKKAEPVKDAMTVQDAIALLQKSGQYVVKKVVKSYKVVYLDSDGSTKVSSRFYRNEGDFKTSPEGANGQKFVSLVKELDRADEESI